MEASLKPLIKKRNDLSKQVKYLSKKTNELSKQDFYWESAILIQELNGMKANMINFENKMKHIQLTIKSKETRWQTLKKEKDGKTLFLKTGQKQLDQLKSDLEKHISIYKKKLKLISIDLKERGRLKSELYELEFMKNELKTAASKDKSNSGKMSTFTNMLKALEVKVSKLKNSLLILKKNNATKVARQSVLLIKLKETPFQLAKIKKEMKELRQQLSTPNPLTQSLPIKIQQVKSKFEPLLKKFNAFYSKFLK